MIIWSIRKKNREVYPPGKTGSSSDSKLSSWRTTGQSNPRTTQAVSNNNGYMTITAQKKVDNDKKNEEGKYIRREHYAGSMSRSFYVGDQLTENDIHAQMNDGILTQQIPKKEEQKQVEDKRHLVQITAA